jgi:hypothetical protein
VRTTDSLIADLQKRADAGEDVRQQILSHGALARLRADRETAVKAGDQRLVNDIDLQIKYQLSFVEQDVDERIVEQPKKDSTKLLADPADVAVKG